MNVLIIGGTGFLGYYTALELLEQGHKVSTIALPDINLEPWYPKEVQVFYGNVFELEKKELVNLMTGFDAMVYAVGPDDRLTPKAPAYDFFFQRLVIACEKVVLAARLAGIKKTVILGSYFAYFNRALPHLKLSEKNSYIHCRMEQEKRSIAAGLDKMDVIILELPYIFGTMPERQPIWTSLLFQRLYNMPIIFFPKGGSLMISVEQVAKATVGGLLYGKHGHKYPVGDVNKSWNELIKLIIKSMSLNPRLIINLPRPVFTIYGHIMHHDAKRKGQEHGLNMKHIFKDIECQYFYINTEKSKRELRYTGGGLDESIIKTVKASMCSLNKNQNIMRLLFQKSLKLLGL